MEVLNHSSVFVLQFLYREQLGIATAGLQLGKETLRGNNSTVLSGDMVERGIPTDQVRQFLKEMTRLPPLKELMSIY